MIYKSDRSKAIILLVILALIYEISFNSFARNDPDTASENNNCHVLIADRVFDGYKKRQFYLKAIKSFR